MEDTAKDRLPSGIFTSQARLQCFSSQPGAHLTDVHLDEDRN